MNDLILTELDGHVATVVLNRPDKLNALTKTMWQQLGETMRALSAREDIRCVVLRGAGNRAFAPGNDISEFEAERGNAVQGKAYGRILHGALSSISDCPHPTIALIEGICVGGGLEIAALCDLRICGESSRFGVPVNRLGLVMAHAEIGALLRLVGRATTLEILLEGRVFDAREALDKGLVTRVVADGQVENETYSAARRIAGGAPLVARWHKRFIRQLEAGNQLTDAELDEGFKCYDTEDFKIGCQAFLRKVRPEFVGK